LHYQTIPILLSRFAATCLCLALFSSDLYAIPTRTIRAVRSSGTITIDGDLREVDWQRPGDTDFLQKDPVEGAPATQKTEVWVAYDDAALYIAARLHDSSPDSIISRIGRRDADLDADWFYVGIDSYHDKRTGFFFGVYAGGTVVDGTLYNDSWDDDSWDGIWDCTAEVNEAGWTVEMKIPYSQLRFPRQDSYTWGINFARNIERRKEESVFVMVPKNESGWVSRFADLTGIENIDPPQRLEFLPYVASGAEYIRSDSGNPFNDGATYVGNAGLDLQSGLGSNLTLNATINPDFGQVEVDPAIVNLTQFETFFEEKRPFFIEGADFLSFGFGGANNNWGFNFGTPEFFYSRRIGRVPQGSVQHEGYEDVPSSTAILGAAKITGKPAEGWSLGSLHALTAREYGTVDSSGSVFSDVVEPLAYYGVLRSRFETDRGRHALGVIGTATVRDLNQPYLSSDFNHLAFTAGLDGWTTLDENDMWVLTGWLAGTAVSGSAERLVSVQKSSLRYYQQPDVDYKHVDSTRTSLSGAGARVALNRQKGNWYLNTALGFLSPGFEANDLGFQFRADMINGHVVTGYRWFQPDGTFRRKYFNIAMFRSYDFGGRRVGDGYMLFAGGQMMGYWGFDLNAGFNPAYVDTRNTRGGPAMRTTNMYFAFLEGFTDSRDPLVFQLGLGAGRSESGGYRYDLAPGVSWKASQGFSISITPSFIRDITIAQWVDNIPDPTATVTYGTRHVFGQIDQTEVSAGIRADWTFTPKLSLQVYLQPLISVGHYTDFKELRQPDTYTFNRYGEGSSTITKNQEAYTVDPDGPGNAAPFSFDDPDFNYKSLRGNVVLRWEYLPGSTIYVAWTQSRINEEDPGEFDFRRDLRNLMSTIGDNVFLVKVSYWFNP
jgi:hypothetical protein